MDGVLLAEERRVFNQPECQTRKGRHNRRVELFRVILRGTVTLPNDQFAQPTDALAIFAVVAARFRN